MSESFENELLEHLARGDNYVPETVADRRRAIESLKPDSYVPLACNWNCSWDAYLPRYLKDNWDKLSNESKMVAFMCCEKMCDLMDVDPIE